VRGASSSSLTADPSSWTFVSDAAAEEEDGPVLGQPYFSHASSAAGLSAAAPADSGFSAEAEVDFSNALVAQRPQAHNSQLQPQAVSDAPAAAAATVQWDAPDVAFGGDSSSAPSGGARLLRAPPTMGGSSRAASSGALAAPVTAGSGAVARRLAGRPPQQQQATAVAEGSFGADLGGAGAAPLATASPLVSGPPPLAPSAASFHASSASSGETAGEEACPSPHDAQGVATAGAYAAGADAVAAAAHLSDAWLHSGATTGSVLQGLEAREFSSDAAFGTLGEVGSAPHSSGAHQPTDDGLVDSNGVW